MRGLESLASCVARSEECLRFDMIMSILLATSRCSKIKLRIQSTESDQSPVSRYLR